jgi:Inorganic Pyrophosphatase
MTELAQAEAQTDRNPSLPQIAAGNYKKGKYRIHGMVVSIENPRGSIRTAKDGSWKVRMPTAYGYLLGTKGADSQHIDCFLGPHHRSPLVYVIDQRDAKTGKWDEHKCFIGFASPKQVKRIYEAAFSDGRAKDRLGDLHEMTISQFRDWLDHGDTTKPFSATKRRASGGRIGFADGGTPVFDDNAPVVPLDQQPTFAPDSPVRNIFDQFDGSMPAPTQAAPDQGIMHAIGHGAASGATFGFSDEIEGLRGAAPKIAGHDIPELVGPVPTRAIAGAGRLVKQWLTGETQASEDYARARDAERQAQREAKAHHPYAYGAGEVAGSIPAMAVLPEAGIVRGAGIGSRLARGAVTGAEYGGLSGAGEGEDLGQRIENAGSGAVGGGAAGFAGAGATELLNAAGQKFVQPVVSTVRGWMNPEAEAARRVATALQRDGEMIAAGTAKGLTPQQWIAARNAGEPVTLADLGAGNTQSLLRSAANTSPEGRAMLEQVIEDRFLNQGERVASDVRRLVAGGANANKTADQLVAEYEAGRAPLYRKAFTRPDAQGMYDDTLEQISQAPVVQQAVRMANITAKNEAAKLGFTPMRQSPFAFDQTGRMTLRDPNVTPNLQYWDAVQKNLDQLGPDGQAWSRTLRDHLDSIVPEYKDARGFAANFFGERDALDAGQKLAGKRVDPDTIK